MNKPVDNADKPVQPPPVSTFGPSRPIGLLIAAAAVVCAGVAWLTADREGRLMLVVAALVLAGVAISDLAFSPRLQASRDGLRIRTPATRTTLPWDQIDTIRVDETTRLGLANRTLEVEAGDLLVVLSRRALGADPREVLDLIEAHRPSR